MLNLSVAPSQERGLKLRLFPYLLLFHRRSFAGAWIEIVGLVDPELPLIVAPSQERGLKFS